MKRMGIKTKLTPRWWVLKWSDGLAWSEVPAGWCSAGTMLCLYFLPSSLIVVVFQGKKCWPCWAASRLKQPDSPVRSAVSIVLMETWCLGLIKCDGVCLKISSLRKGRIYFSEYPCGAENRQSSERISLGLRQCKRPFGDRTTAIQFVLD